MSILNVSGRQLRQNQDQADWLWTAVLLAAALLLFTINLGGLPLRDWDEGTVAQVAREIWRSPSHSLTWLFPTLGGEPYLNKPPLMHNLMAIAYRLGGVNEFTSRLPGAWLTAVSVPLLYWVGRELFPMRLSALLAAAVYLTWLPVVRHGRLAMLDGAVLCFWLLLLWSVLRSRRDSRFALGIGIGFGLICLTKGVMLGLLLGAIALGFLAWDTPRLLRLPYLWLGVAIGSFPVTVWYGAQWGQYGADFLGGNLVDQSFQRVWTRVENNGGAPWYYVLELLKYSVPWLLFLPAGFSFMRESLLLGWAKLALIWSGVYLVAISVMATKLPWYVLPLYPALALVVGAQLAQLWKQGKHAGIRQQRRDYALGWVGAIAVLACLSGVGCAYFWHWSQPEDPSLVRILGSFSISMTLAAVLMWRQNPQFISLLIWGTYLSLLLLMLSPHWVWELAEAYPVKPVAELVQQYTPPGETIYTSYADRRPSLDFYSDRRILPAPAKRLQRLWQTEPQVYFLLDRDRLKTLDLPKRQILGEAEGWILVRGDR